MYTQWNQPCSERKRPLPHKALKKQRQKVLYTEIFVQEAFNEIEAHAKESLIAMEEGDSLRMMLSALRKLTRVTPKNVIQKNARHGRHF